jgi:hypothetical protein
MYVCMYVCMVCVRTCSCMYVLMYVCMYVALMYASCRATYVFRYILQHVYIKSTRVWMPYIISYIQGTHPYTGRLGICAWYIVYVSMYEIQPGKMHTFIYIQPRHPHTYTHTTHTHTHTGRHIYRHPYTGRLCICAWYIVYVSMYKIQPGKMHTYMNHPGSQWRV